MQISGVNWIYAIFAGSYRSGCYRSTVTLDVDNYCGSFHVGTENVPVTVTLAGPCTRGITVTPSVKIGTDDEVFGITIAIPLGIGTEASEEENYELDIADFISTLNESIDMAFISNPNGTTSQVIDRESLEFIAKICAGNDIALVVDEEYMDFVQDKDDCTAIPLVKEYDNLYVLRNTSKFFAVPGLRLAYAITSNPVFKKTMSITGFPYAINALAEAAGIDITSALNQPSTT